MTAWVLRAGKYGEREQWALENGVAGGGFQELNDLTPLTSKKQVRAAVDETLPQALLGKRINVAGQLWALRNSIRQGDIIVMPMKTTKKIAIGVCEGGYVHRADERASDRRHSIRVDWKATDISRAAIKDDLLNTLGGAMTVFQASKNNAEERLRAVLETGVDPGNAAIASAETAAKDNRSAAIVDAEDSVVDPAPVPTLESIRDRVRTHLVENFKGHRLTELVADILRVEGYVCDVSSPGPDQGVDIIAGRGPLGLDSPTLIVEVKSEAGRSVRR